MSWRNPEYTSPAIDRNGDASSTYWSATIANGTTVDVSGDGSGFDQIVTFNESRTNNIISCPTNYELAVLRADFLGCGKTLPVLIGAVQVGQSDPALTIWSFTLSCQVIWNDGTVAGTFNGVAQRFVRWVSPSANTPTPAAPLTGQDVTTTNWYWAYDYDVFLAMCNTALQNALTDTTPVGPGVPSLSLNAQFQAWWTAQGGVGAPPSLATTAPYIMWNPSSGLFSIYCDAFGFTASRSSAGSGSDDEAFRLFMNSNSETLFSNFETRYFQGGDSNLGQDIEVVCRNRLWQNHVTVASPPAPAALAWFVQTQQFESTSTNWSPVGSLAFTTSNLPTVSELEAAPVLFGGSNVGNQTTSLPVTNTIITDVSLPVDAAWQWRSLIQYAPVGPYRFITMQGLSPISRVSINCWWRMRQTGLLVPLQMNNGASVSIKILLKRRTELRSNGDFS